MIIPVFFALLGAVICAGDPIVREKTKPVKFGSYQDKSYFYGKDIEVTNHYSPRNICQKISFKGLDEFSTKMFSRRHGTAQSHHKSRGNQFLEYRDKG